MCQNDIFYERPDGDALSAIDDKFRNIINKYTNICIFLIEMLSLQHFHNTFTINFKWHVIKSCYW